MMWKQNPTIVAQRIDVRAQKTIEVDFDRGTTLGVSLAHDQRTVFDEAVPFFHALG